MPCLIYLLSYPVLCLTLLIYQFMANSHIGQVKQNWVMMGHVVSVVNSESFSWKLAICLVSYWKCDIICNCASVCVLSLNSMSMIGRRGLSSLRAVVLVALVLLIVYGYYTYNELQTELRKRDSREERVKRQLDTVSSELESKWWLSLSCRLYVFE